MLDRDLATHRSSWTLAAAAFTVLTGCSAIGIDEHALARCVTDNDCTIEGVLRRVGGAMAEPGL